MIYGNRCKEQIIYSEELQNLSVECGTEVIHVLSEPEKDWGGERGMVSASLIEKVFSDAAKQKWLYVLCGPTAMMETVEETLIRMGVPRHQILSEKFKYD